MQHIHNPSKKKNNNLDSPRSIAKEQRPAALITPGVYARESSLSFALIAATARRQIRIFSGAREACGTRTYTGIYN